MRRLLPGSRRSWILLLVAVALVVVAVRVQQPTVPIFSYRVIDDDTLAIQTVTGPWTWTRLTGVAETPSSITVGVGALSVPLPGYGGDILELTVTLQDPIDGRTVIDGSSGLPVPRSEQ